MKSQPRSLDDPLPKTLAEIGAELDYWVQPVGQNDPGSPYESRLQARIEELRSRQTQLRMPAATHEPPTYYGRPLLWAKNSKVIATLLLRATGLGLLAGFTNTVKTLR